MHDLGSGRTANADRPQVAVLCGVEALSAQQWVVGAISFCVDVLRKAANGAASPRRFAEPIRASRELKGEADMRRSTS